MVGESSKKHMRDRILAFIKICTGRGFLHVINSDIDYFLLVLLMTSMCPFGISSALPSNGHFIPAQDMKAT